MPVIGKARKILESYNKNYCSANGSKIIENCAKNFPDKNSPAPKQIFESRKSLFFAFASAVLQNFKSVCRAVAVRHKSVVLSKNDVSERIIKMAYAFDKPFFNTAFDISDLSCYKMISAADLADKTDSCYIKELINTEIQIF